MSSPLATTPHELDTEFFSGHARHRTSVRGSSSGQPRVAVETWYRDGELGRGISGIVYLERSGGGECRAVKEVTKYKYITDYRRELEALAKLAKYDDLFVKVSGWYETGDHVCIAMEYMSQGNLRQYLEVARSESEANDITRQLLKGLCVVHQEGFAHSDLKPENIFVASTSPIWVKIGDFGLAELAREGTAILTEGGIGNYVAPEVGIDIYHGESEYTNAMDIWALGCITYEMLTRTLPFRGFTELSSYRSYPILPRNNMLSKGVSNSGIDFVEKALAYPPEHRITASGALGLEWMRYGGLGIEEDGAGRVLLLHQGKRRPDTPSIIQGTGSVFRKNFDWGIRVPEPLGQDHRGYTDGKELGELSKKGGRRVLAGSLLPQIGSLELDEVNVRKRVYDRKGPVDDGSLVTERIWPELESGDGVPDGSPASDETLLAGRRAADQTALQTAARNGDLEAVTRLLSQGVEPDLKDESGRTPLSYAAGNGHGEVVGLLLDWGGVDAHPDANLVDNKRRKPLFFKAGNKLEAMARDATIMQSQRRFDCNSKDKSNRTPLSYAAENGRDAVVMLLLSRRDVDGNRVDRWGRTPLSYAAENGHDAVVMLLLGWRGVNPNLVDSQGRAPPSYAAQNGHSEVLLQLLLQEGVDPDSKDKSNRTPLSYAAQSGHEAVMMLLLDWPSVDPGSRDESNRTPLSYAAQSGHEVVVSLLLRHEAVDPDLVDGSKRAPLSYAAQSGHEAIVRRLLCLEPVDPDSRDESNRTPMSYAAQSGHEAVVRLLLDWRGVDANLVDSQGRTPLSYAAENGHEAVIKLLLGSSGMYPDSLDAANRTPLSYAALSGHEAVVRRLLSREDVDPNSKDKSNLTPLSLAARNGHEGVVRLLVNQKDANPNLVDDQGRTLLSYAAENGNLEVVKLLLFREGVDQDLMDETYRTPLSYAAENGHKAVVQLLLDRPGMDPNSEDELTRTQLWYAARNGHEEVVRLLVNRKDANSNLVDDQGRTLLSHAAGNGHSAVVLLLLDWPGVDPNSKDELNRTPLSYAAGNGHSAVVRLLLDWPSVDPNSKDRSGWTPLSYAAQSGQSAVVSLLLRRGAVDPDSVDGSNRTPLSYAAQSGHLEVVMQLLSREDVDPNSKEKSNRTPLSYAALNGDEAVVRQFLYREDVDANLGDSRGRTLLSYAAENGFAAVVRHLVNRRDVDANSRDESNRTPLSYAAENGHFEVVDLLLFREDVDQDSMDEANRTPPSYAAENGHEEVVRLILDQPGVDLNSKDELYRTPLSYATRNGHEEVVRLLVNQDANPNLVDDRGRTLLSYAAGNGHLEVVRLLLFREGVDCNSMDEANRTPLSYAAENGHQEVVRLLLNWPGVDPNPKDETNRTPLSYAAQSGNEAVVRLLLGRGEVKVNLEDTKGRAPLPSTTGSEHETVEDNFVKQGKDTQSLVDGGSSVPEQLIPDLGQNEKYPTGAVADQDAQGAGFAIQAHELESPVAIISQNRVDQWPARFANGKTNIRFDNGDVWSLSNHIKGLIEDYIGAPVDWWPLSPREATLPGGFTRVRWTCCCGEKLSAIRSAAFRISLEQWLYTRDGELPAPSTHSTSQQGDPGPAVSGGNPGGTPPPASSPQPSQSSPVIQGRGAASVATSGSSDNTPSPPPPSPQSSSASQEGDLAPVGAGGSSNGAPPIPHPPPQGPPCTDQTGRGNSPPEPARMRYLLWCINLGKYHTEVETIPVAMSDNDKTIFGKLRQTYDEAGSWERVILILFRCLHTLEGIRYVKFTRYHNKRVECGREHELPDPDNVKYEYEFPYERGIPPFPVEGLLHFFRNPSCAGTSAFALISFPKKKSEEVDNVSWGLHAYERLSAARVLGVVGLGFLAPAIFAAWRLDKHPDDIQNAFSPCTLYLAFVALCFAVHVHCAANKGMA